MARCRRIASPVILVAGMVLVSPAAAGDTAVIPLEEIRPGQRGVAHTVFEGAEPEPFEVEVLGVARNSLGPGRDLIIVRLVGERVEHTGVVAGMSGSPVEIEGRLAGALSYRIGTFPREPIAGVTPFRYMQEIPGERPVAGPGAGEDETLVLARDREKGEMAILAPPSPASSGLGETLPIIAPIQFGGGDPRLVEELAPTFQRAGWVTVAGGGDGEAPGDRPASLRPGDAVGAQLMRGDLSLTGTGTVTAVEGGRVWAFGHPFLRAGRGQLPMTTVEIVTTVPSDFNSFKLGNTGSTIGVFDEDRYSGIAGWLGVEPVLIPISVRVQPVTGSAAAYSYEVVDHPDWTPFLVQTAALSSLFFDTSNGADVTLALSATIEIEGQETVRFHEAYSRTGAGPAPAIAAASDVGRLAAALVANRFEDADLRRVSLDVDVVEERRYVIVEDAWPARLQVRPGEVLDLQVALQPYRAPRETRSVRLPIPEGTPPGNLEIVVGGAAALDRYEARTIQAVLAQLPDLPATIRFLNGLRSSDRLHVQAYRRTSGVVIDGRQLPDLPRTAHDVLSGEGPTGSLASLDRRAIAGASLPFPGPVLGGQLVRVQVVEGGGRTEPEDGR